MKTQTHNQEPESLKSGNEQTRSSAFQALLFGSSSSTMFLLFGHGVVSEANKAAFAVRLLTSSSKRGVQNYNATS